MKRIQQDDGVELDLILTKLPTDVVYRIWSTLRRSELQVFRYISRECYSLLYHYYKQKKKLDRYEHFNASIIWREISCPGISNYFVWMMGCYESTYHTIPHEGVEMLSSCIVRDNLEKFSFIEKHYYPLSKLKDKQISNLFSSVCFYYARRCMEYVVKVCPIFLESSCDSDIHMINMTLPSDLFSNVTHTYKECFNYAIETAVISEDQSYLLRWGRSNISPQEIEERSKSFRAYWRENVWKRILD